MTIYSEEFLIHAHAFSSMHREALLNSNACLCFYCLEKFPPDKIEEWTDEENNLGQTAICPFCGIDSVLGDSSNLPLGDANFLMAMQEYFF